MESRSTKKSNELIFLKHFVSTPFDITMNSVNVLRAELEKYFIVAKKCTKKIVYEIKDFTPRNYHKILFRPYHLIRLIILSKIIALEKYLISDKNGLFTRTCSFLPFN